MMSAEKHDANCRIDSEQREVELERDHVERRKSYSECK